MLCVGRGGIGERRTPGPYPDLMEDRIGLDTVWAIGSCAFMADLFFLINLACTILLRLTAVRIRQRDYRPGLPLCR